MFKNFQFLKRKFIELKKIKFDNCTSSIIEINFIVLTMEIRACILDKI